MGLDKKTHGTAGFRFHLDYLTELPLTIDGDDAVMTVPYNFDSLTFVDGESGLSLDLFTKTGDYEWTWENPDLAEGHSVFVGVPYASEFELSKWYVKARQDVSTVGDKINLTAIVLAFSNTGYFKITTQQTDDDAVEQDYTGVVLGSVTLGKAVLTTSEERFNIQGVASQTRIKVSNDTHYPSSFQTGQLEGDISRLTQVVA